MSGELQNWLSNLESWSTIIRNFDLVIAAVTAMLDRLLHRGQLADMPTSQGSAHIGVEIQHKDPVS